MTELTYNVDEWYLSTYLSKDRGGKLKLGPFWDFDRSLGNTTQIGGAGTTGWYSDALVNFFANYLGIPAAQVVEYPWFRRLFQDSDFSQRYIDRYQELRRRCFRKQLSHSRSTGWRQSGSITGRNFQSGPRSIQPLAQLAGLSHLPTHVNHLSLITQRLAWIDSPYLPGPLFQSERRECPGRV